MAVVVPNPALRIWRGREDPAPWPYHATGLANQPNRVGDVLQEILHYHRVEALIGERQRLVDVALDHVAPETPCDLDGLRRAVDPRV